MSMMRIVLRTIRITESTLYQKSLNCKTTKPTLESTESIKSLKTSN